MVFLDHTDSLILAWNQLWSQGNYLFIYLFYILIILPRVKVQLKKAQIFNDILAWFG